MASTVRLPRLRRATASTLSDNQTSATGSVTGRSVLVFDFDGTIVDSLGEIVQTFNAIATRWGYAPTTPEEIAEIKRLSSRQVLQNSRIPIPMLVLIAWQARQVLNRRIDQLQTYPGMVAALTQLKQEGYRLGIVSSNATRNIQVFLRSQQLDGLFDFVYGSRTVFGKARTLQMMMQREKLTADRLLYIGDETRDIAATRRYTIPTLAVTWGFSDAEALAAENPVGLVHRLEELPGAIAQFEQQRQSRSA